MKMVSMKHHRYGGRLLSPDDEFTAGPRDARLLVALKRARKADSVVPAIEAPHPYSAAYTDAKFNRLETYPPEPVPAATPNQADTYTADAANILSDSDQAEPESEPTSDEAPVRVKRKYKRRDMTAGD